ncbi:MAG TPA: helix-turn-helix domain-containing protein [Solirubrobacterales bacterium]
MARAYAVADPGETFDPEYVEGLRAVIPAALDYGLDAIERGEERSSLPPPALLAQARLAARNGVNLDTVLRRYFAGYTLLGDFLIEEAKGADLLGATELKRLLRTQATLFDRLIAAITVEYARESEGRLDTAEQRRAERVKRLLDGELLDTAELRYDFDAHHLGAIGVGPGAGDAFRELAKSLDRRLLAICPGGDSVWAWFGARGALDPEHLEHHISLDWPSRVSLALGEPTQGLAGWRLTHQQARATLPIALRKPQTFVRYADVALLASVLQDDVFTTSLRQLYLVPLEVGHDGGDAARETLRAYFAAGCNVSSAAAALGVKRHTVTNRIRVIEEQIHRPLSSCSAEMETALHLESLSS